LFANGFDHESPLRGGFNLVGQYGCGTQAWSEDIDSSLLYFFLRILGYINENREKFDILNQ
jgi:hypothetical protein